MSVPAGWYPQPDGRQRYWDGELWTENFAVAAPPPLVTPEAASMTTTPGAPPVTPPVVGPVQADIGIQAIPDGTRKARLAQAIQQEVVAGGRVEALGEFNAVIRFGKPINHVLHLLLTLITFGLWAIVWIIMAIDHSSKNYTVTLNVEKYGSLSRYKI